MKLEEIAQSTNQTLTCAVVGDVIGVKGESIHLQAMVQPERLGFPVIVVGNRVLIPKAPFLKFMGYGENK